MHSSTSTNVHITQNYTSSTNGNGNDKSYSDAPPEIHSVVVSPNQQLTKPMHALEKEYSVYLEKYTKFFTQDEHYLNVGVPKVTQGWKLHLTVTSPSIKPFLDKVLPILLHYQAPFKLIKTHDLHEGVNAGDYGSSKVGKIITVLLDNEGSIEELTKQLKEVTNSFEGPQVVTDFYIGKNVYARYGSFCSLIEIDPYGNHKRLIKDSMGNYIQDHYSLPPTVPAGITNPFIGIADQVPQFSSRRIIGNKYILLKPLKLDLKGNVYKAFYFNKFLIPTSCVVKEGRKGVFPDIENRDVRRRLWWQKEAYLKVRNNIRTPNVIDLIEEPDVSYLVTQYVPKAINLNFSLIRDMKRIPWAFQSDEVKRNLTQLLEKMLAPMIKLHDLNLIHRDFTDNNLLINRKKEVWSIDLELLYSSNDQQPDPPFGTGTPGFMSPQQEEGEIPDRSDDCYSFGGMIVLFLSGGIEPAYIVDQNLPLLKKRLLFLSGSEVLSSLACNCLHPDPSKRATTTTIQSGLLQYKLEELSPSKTVNIPSPTREEIKELIQRSVRTIGSHFMTYNDLWTIPIRQDESWDVYPMSNKHVYSNLHQGVSGVIYGLSVLKDAGIDIDAANQNINAAFQFVLQDIDRRMNNMAPSLYYGKAGLVIMFNQLISSSMMESHPHYLDLMVKLLESPAQDFNVMYGIAGQGLAALKSKDVIGVDTAKRFLETIAWILKANQHNNGGWNKNTAATEKEMATGFGYGVAGIIYFLLKYGELFNDHDVLQSAIRGMNYLENSKQKKDNSLQWPIDKNSKEHGAWWCAGSPGIALTFLKAYQITTDYKYCDIAEKALRIHSPNLSYFKLGQCHGMAGLGEAYLQAYEITQREEWLSRSQRIADFLFHVRKEDRDGNVYWLSDKYNMPSANFMLGDAGILHFLTRFINQGKLDFPVIG